MVTRGSFRTIGWGMMVGLLSLLALALFAGVLATPSRLNQAVLDLLSQPQPLSGQGAASLRYADPGISGMPLLSFDLPTVGTALLLGLLVPLVLLAVGACLLALGLGPLLQRLSVVQAGGLAVILGAFACAGMALLLQPLPSRALLGAGLGLLFLCLARVTFPTLRRYVQGLEPGFSRPPTLHLFLGGLVYLTWIALIPLSPYPSLPALALGDLPSYCSAAMNVAAGRGLSEDYFVADYVGGVYGYFATSASLPVLCIAFFYQLFGVNGITAFVFFSFMGWSAIIALIEPISARKDQLLFPLFAGLLLFLHPAFYLNLGVGIGSTPLCLSLALFWAFYTSPPFPRPVQLPLLGLLLAFNLVIRPEGAVLSVLLMGMLALRHGLVECSSRLVRRTLPLLLLLGGDALWLHLDRLPVPDALRPLAIFHARLDPEQTAFDFPHHPWWRFNQVLCDQYLRGLRQIPLPNLELISQIAQQPALFARFVLDRSLEAFRAVGAMLSRDDLVLVNELICVGLVLLALGKPGRARWLVGAVFGLVLLLPLLNRGAGERHYFPAVALLLAMALASLAHWWPRGDFPPAFRPFLRPLRGVTLLGGLILLLHHSLTLGELRTHPGNRSYDQALQTLKERVPRDALLMSSYPQLLTCVLGARKVVGGTFLSLSLPWALLVYQPDYVLLDDLREGPPNYSLFMQMPGIWQRDYEVLVHRPEGHYLILKRKAG